MTKSLTDLRRLAAGLCIAVLLFACAVATGHASSLTNQLSGLLETVSGQKDVPGPALSDDEVYKLRAYYEARDFSPVWITADGPGNSARLLLAELQRSPAHGLLPDFYKTGKLLSLAESSDNKELAHLELGLSKAFVKYANDIANGFVRSGMDESHTIVAPVIYEPAVLLDAAGDADGLRSFLKTLLPTDDRYVRLISKMAELLRIEKLGAWPEIRNLGSSTNPAVDPDRVRDLLLLTGDLQSTDLLRANDDALIMKRAIARFQARHGLEPTQRVDAPTYREMAKPLEARIDLIRINLERRRWQNRELGANHVYINIADNSVRFVRDFEKSGNAAFRDNGSLAKLPTFTGSLTSVGLTDDNRLTIGIISDTGIGLLATRPQVDLILEGDPSKNLSYMLGKSAAANLALSTSSVIELDEPVPAFVTYLTVWANKDGSINFRKDRYKRDREITELLSTASAN